jgi:diguanylate cyclase (GGDEF)-like protein
LGVGSSVTQEELRACLDVGKALTSSLSLDVVLVKIMEHIAGRVPATDWSLLLRDEATGRLQFKIFGGTLDHRMQDVIIEPGEGLAGLCAEQGTPLFIRDVRADGRHSARIDKMTEFTTRSVVCLPLKCHGKVLGVVEVINPEEPSILEENLPPVLDILLDYAAIAIDNSRHYEQAQRMAVTDDYTGLPNARALHAFLDELFAEDPKDHISVVFIDMDNFKDIVDTYGHLEGSRVLREVGQAFLSAMGQGDRLFKYGGDEYVAVLTGKDARESLSVVQRMRNAVISRAYLIDVEREGVRVTASFGIATYPEDASSKKDLLKAADRTMYRVKNGAKNGISSARAWKN